MAGFLINGCGAADSYYKIKDLNSAYCKCCGKERLFALMELKMKIRIIFIPTVPIKTTYAVVCTKCKEGYYVNLEQKEFILNHPASCVEIQENGVVIHGIENLQQLKIEPDAQAEEVLAVCQCGKQILPGAVFCGSCGRRIAKEEETAAAVQDMEWQDFKEQIKQPEAQSFQTVSKEYDIPSMTQFRQRKICPSCKLLFTMNKEICNICGSKLVEKE